MQAHSYLSSRRAAWLLVALGSVAPVAGAIDFGDMMNPGRWFGGNRDRGDYYYREYGPYGPGYVPPYAPGYGYPPYSVPGYVPPGYGAPPVAAPALQQSAPAMPAVTVQDAKDREIEELKRRLEQLEAAQRRPPSAPGMMPGAFQGGSPSGEPWPGSVPQFRPLEQN